MGSRFTALIFLATVFASAPLPTMYACGYCKQPPETSHPPNFKRPRPVSPLPRKKPPVVIVPPVIVTPPVIPPPVITPPVITPPVVSPPSGGGVPSTNPSPSSSAKCPIDTLKLGLCVDVLGGLVHAGLGNPVVNTCCPVLGGLLELEAAVCLCTTIRLKLLNLNIVIPLTLQAMISCGKTLPPDFICPPPS